MKTHETKYIRQPNGEIYLYKRPMDTQQKDELPLANAALHVYANSEAVQNYERVKAQRDEAQAHAQRLADALKSVLGIDRGGFAKELEAIIGTCARNEAREALAQWEGDKQ